ncbi:uncharacterized protein LOC124151839 [Haliotis rufescens]|uniref:uncharacterized protein LOC124151839 n=1 Tax=Haliotis rufescens TaxID=6454 RepID=UPI001EB0743A|nr:uncharacterized protein LOC124151839 [Haliotis rufescens]
MEAVMMAAVPCCASCGQIFSVMKRCVRCQAVFYCSRACQIKDWGVHKSNCLKRMDSECCRSTSSSYGHDRTRMFTGESDKANSRSATDTSASLTRSDGNSVHADFHTADDRLMASSAQSAPVSDDRGLSYLHNNLHLHDVPVFHVDKAYCDINVKANKQKFKLQIQHDWTGQEILKLFACHVHIPLERMKVVHRGKIMTDVLIREYINPKSVFQVFGEKSADETGLDQRDIVIMMAQMNIDRNRAVQALQTRGNLIDAIFEASNKI